MLAKSSSSTNNSEKTQSKAGAKQKCLAVITERVVRKRSAKSNFEEFATNKKQPKTNPAEPRMTRKRQCKS